MTTPTIRRSVAKQVSEAAGARVGALQRGYLKDESWAVAALAQLRGGAGKLPEEAHDLVGLTGAEGLYDEGGLSETEEIRAEAALFLAVTLYALHQQSRSEQGMHRRGVELGAAVRRLMPPGDLDVPILERFKSVGAAETRAALAERLRQIVSLLRRESIPLDYALLAEQLYLAQTPEGMRQVRARWGRSFHAYRSTDSGDAGSTDKDSR
ncbi:type I-E CRISPR-associated protein Cse2/CasB [Streptosporangium sp. NPDC020145]|uniref:type I-E CRISPR-associated protein Cse2/CasB n=1 Tax=Streptosporangium sp. NPDC020145 TaxID=3154694 RepID=UPI00341622F3